MADVMTGLAISSDNGVPGVGDFLAAAVPQIGPCGKAMTDCLLAEFQRRTVKHSMNKNLDGDCVSNNHQKKIVKTKDSSIARASYRVGARI